MHQSLHLGRVGTNDRMPDSTKAEPEQNDPMGPRRPDRAPNQSDRELARRFRLGPHVLPRLLNQGLADTQNFFRITQLVQSIKSRLHDVEGVAPP